MAAFITHKTPRDFLKYNHDFIYDNYFTHYHLIIIIEKLQDKEVELFDAYNIIDENGSYVLCMWVTGCYYLYGFKWTDEIIEMLASKIEMQKYTPRFNFLGRKELIIELFNKCNAPYNLFKDRLVYHCKQVSENTKPITGKIENATFKDFDELVKMSEAYYIEEYDGKGEKTIDQISASVAHGITTTTLYLLKDSETICSILQVINEDSKKQMIGTLFTKKAKRNRGHSFSLLYTVTEGLLKTGYEECGLLSDITNPSSNKVFLNVGYKPIYNWVSAHKSTK